MKWLHIAIRFVIGYLATIGLVFGTQWTYYNYLDFYQLPSIREPIPILNQNKEISVGDTILMELKISKPELHSPVDNSVNITCEDGNLITLASSQNAGAIPSGDFLLISQNYKMPAKAAVGSKCQFNFINVYQPNPFKTETVVWTSETFMVVGE